MIDRNERQRREKMAKIGSTNVAERSGGG